MIRRESGLVRRACKDPSYRPVGCRTLRLKGGYAVRYGHHLAVERSPVTNKAWFYAIRTAALIEAAKGTLVLALGVGLASGLRRHAQHLLGRWAAHVDPLAHLSHVLARVGDLLNQVDAPVVFAVAALYAGARYLEAYGLWHARRWALWLGAFTGAIFVPFEIIELVRKPGVLSSAILVANLVIVGILVRPLVAKAGGN